VLNAPGNVILDGVITNKRTARNATPELHGETSGMFTSTGTGAAWIVEYGDFVHVHVTYSWSSKASAVGDMELRITSDPLPNQFTGMVKTTFQITNRSGLGSALADIAVHAEIFSGGNSFSFVTGQGVYLEPPDFKTSGTIEIEGWYMK